MRPGAGRRGPAAPARGRKRGGAAVLGRWGREEETHARLTPRDPVGWRGASSSSRSYGGEAGKGPRQKTASGIAARRGDVEMSPYLKIKGGTSPGGGQADAEAEGAGPFPGAGPRVSDTTGRECALRPICPRKL
ncbi:Ribitol-5-Phosphate Xylosyltransferase 1 [Manis pentadactyla]|nr:Ribitol-5-Phosphate Xylosyltransferase 1 [Manis pentadactyla]